MRIFPKAMNSRRHLQYCIYILIFSLGVNLEGTAQSSCSEAVLLTPGTEQCGSTEISGDGIDNNVCLGIIDESNDYILKYTVPSQENGMLLMLQLTANTENVGISLTNGCPESGTYDCLGAESGAAELTLVSPPLIGGTTYWIHLSSPPGTPVMDFCLSSFIGIEGCTNVLANNYDPLAIVDDGSCSFPDPLSDCGAYSKNISKNIPDLGVLLDTLNANAQDNEVIVDLDLALVIQHDYMPDLEVSLISPSGLEMKLFQDECPGTDSLRLRLDDDSGPFDCNAFVSIGYFSPSTGILQGFNGTLLDGDWVLKIEDDALGDIGQLYSWCLIPELIEVECLSPSAVTILEVSSSTALINWNENNMPPASEWEFELVPLGSTPSGIPTHTNITSPPYLLTGLQPAITYRVYVRSVCGPIPGEWSNPKQFTTALSNPTACGIGLPIADCGFGPLNNFTINVDNAPGSSLGSDVFLKEINIIIEHDYNGDLDFSLISPSGVEVLLSSDNGGGEPNYGIPEDVLCAGATSFSPLACFKISSDDVYPPFLGDYLPEGDMNDFYDGSDPNGNWTFSICDDAGDDVGKLQYLELVFEAAVCTPPADFSVQNIDASSAELTWSADADCTDLYLEYGPSGFLPGVDENPGSLQSQVVSLGCGTGQPYTLNGLMETTSYDFYIRQSCSGGGFSINSCLVSATTGCETGPLTEEETFDEQESCSTSCSASCSISGTWTNSNNDDFDWIVDQYTTPSGKTGPEDDITGGGKFIYIETSSSACPEGGRAILESGCMDVMASSGSCHFSFFCHMKGKDIGRLQLLVKPVDELVWDTLWFLNGEQGDDWFQNYIDLSNYDGQTVQFRFEGYKGEGVRGDIAIDQLQFFGTQDSGQPSFVYYLDNDEDGFGSQNDSILSCSAVTPPFYVANKLDCNDNNELINPVAVEVPCNQLDDNCNGFADDSILFDPQVESDTVCGVGNYTITPQSNAFGTYYWYDMSDTSLLGLGNILPIFLNQNINIGIRDSLTIDGQVCESQLITFNISVLDQLELTVGEINACQGDTVDLISFNMIDTNALPGELVFYESYPNLPINDPAHYAKESGTYQVVVELSAQGDCVKVDSFLVHFNEKPEVDILPDTAISLCSGKAFELNAVSLGGGAPLSFEWSNGFTDSTITVFGSPIPGNSEVYEVTLTDVFGCSSSDQIVVNTAQSISAASIDDLQNVNLCNGNNGSFIVSPLNGIAPFDYVWEGPVNGVENDINGSLSIQDLEQGAYRLTITDSAPVECPMVIPLIIINGPSIVVNEVNIEPVECSGDQNGRIELDITANNPVFNWSNGENTAIIDSLEGGKYSVTIVDDFCSIVLDDLEVTESNPIEITNSQIEDQSCSNTIDGSIDIIIKGGVKPYLYEWSTGSFNSSLDMLAEGDYSLTVTDFNGCTFQDSFQIKAPDSLILNIEETTDPSCFDSEDGTIRTDVSGGTPGYDYHWNNGENESDLLSLPSGSYQLTLTDANGCTAHSATIELFDPPALLALVDTIIDASCNNANNGLIQVSVTGGFPPYNYEWSNGSVDETPSNLLPGTYSLTVSDSQDCEYILSDLLVSAPEVLQVEIDMATGPTCVGVNDGEIAVQVIGGIAPFSYMWNNGDTTAQATGLGPGSYQCEVFDANGCSNISTSLLLNAPQLLDGEIDYSQDVSCHGASDGQIFITVSGGTGPYTYFWNDSSAVADRVDLSPGKFACVVTDAIGCEITLPTLEIDEPKELVINVNSIEDVLCNGQDNGSIDVSVTGGVPPYIYSWDNGSELEDLENAVAGIYKLTVIDENGCIRSRDGLVVGEPDPISVAVEGLDEVDCDGNEGGSADITVSGGNNPFEYAWSNGSDEEDLINVDAGIYSLTITDTNNCLAIRPNIQVIDPTDTLSVALDTSSSVSCFGANDGSISAIIEGGSLPYQFLWSNGVINEPEIFNLPAGNYRLTVTDANGCVSTSPLVSIATPPPLVVDLDSLHLPFCDNDSTGALFVSPEGGQGNFSFVWMNISGDTVGNKEDLINIPSGKYFVNVVDNEGCTTTSPIFTINDPNNFLVSFGEVQGSCPEDSTGSIQIMIQGGSSPLSYEWSNGSIQKDLTNVPSGVYQVTVTDQNGCETVSEFQEVNNLSASPIQANVDEVVDVSCFEEAEGTISISVNGGAPPYNYSWNHGAIIEDLNNLPAGNYNCTITDTTGCNFVTTTIKVSQPDTGIYHLLDTIVENSCPGDNQGGIYIDLAGGTPPYEVEWNTGVKVEDIFGLKEGAYWFSVTDALGCLYSSPVYSINDPAPFDVDVLLENPTFGNSNGQIEVSVSGANPPYDYLWSANTGSQTTPNVINITEGIYAVTITDAELCDTVISIQVDFVSSVVGNNTNSDLFAVYPNPADSYVNLEWKGTSATELTLQMLHTSGQVVGRWQRAGTPDRIERLDIGDVPAGLYWLKVEEEDGLVDVIKVVIY